MADCRYKKRLQFYLDGWVDERNARDIEKHLKHCSECQVELTELEELNAAALEMLDEAPDREYWDSFAIRVRNRILSRNVEPVHVIRKTPWYLSLRLASVIVIVLAVSIISIGLLRTGQMTVSPIVTLKAPAGTSEQLRQVETLPSPAQIEAANSQAQDLAGSNPELTAKTPERAPSTPRGLNRTNGNSVKSVFATNKPGDLELKEPADYLRANSQSSKASQNPAFGNQPIAVAYSGPDLVDPSFRMKSSFVGQRIMAGLAMDSPDKSRSTFYSFNSNSSMTSLSQLGDDISSSWGYLRVAADTSKANEIKKYFIELELMQSK